MQVDGPAALSPTNLEDAAHLAGGHARGMAFPASEFDVAVLMRRQEPLLPIGAQSSVTGGATPMGELLVSSARLQSIVEFGDGCVRAQAGVPLDALVAALDVRGDAYPPVPTWTAATVGGIVSTNAAGPATFKYGVTRDWVLGLTLVLPCGDVLELRRGAACVDGHGALRLSTTAGDIDVTIPSLPMPDVPKRSAGYHCAAGMDAIDLFVGAEGTLGFVVDATLRTVRRRGNTARALVPVKTEAAALAFVRALRDASHETWRLGNPHGIDISAIEHLDRRSMELLREDGVDRRERFTCPADTSVVLLVDVDLADVDGAEEAWQQMASALDPGSTDSALGRLCRLAAAHDLLDDMEIALPGDTRRIANMTNVREAVPAAVNARIARARSTFGDGVQKTAADMIVRWDRFGDMMRACRHAFETRGLDYAVWGHISDGNVHPNLIPHRAEDVPAGKAAVLDLGRAVIEMGGCPLAEHGVGRHPVKKQLLKMLYGDEGIAAMRRIKDAIDPQHLMAPGVLF
jgi:D-lactate dehydrogenase (cytochrome)